jgi:hypothetical protein
MIRRAVLAAVGAALGMTLLLAPGARATMTRGTAGTPVTIKVEGPTGSTTTTATIQPDGTYKADFGISQLGDYTITVTRADGTTATKPFTVTRDPEGCVPPASGTGIDAGVTHTPFPLDPRFPSYITVCGRLALTPTTTTTLARTTPAGTPPVIGNGASVSRDKPDADSEKSGSSSDDDDSDVPWLLVAIVVIAVGVVVIVVLLVRRARDDAVGSMYPDYEDTPPTDPPPPGPSDDQPPTPPLDVM